MPVPMLDPVLSEIVKNALLMVAQEAGIRAARSAGSTFVSQSAEVACALFDKDARLIAQTDVGQMHLSALRSMLAETLKDHPPETLTDGDILITNDHFRGGIHPTDVGAFRPIFHDGKPAFYCGVMMIVSDLGGISAGGLPANATECFHEGLIIPPLKLYKAGVLDQGLSQMIRANSRTPDKIAADIDALAAGGNVAAKRLGELVAKYGYEKLSAIIDELLDYSERLVRQGIAKMPPGKYRGSYEVEEDGIEPDKTYMVQVEVTIDGSTASFDFTGTSPQARGAINCSYSQSLSCVVFALRCYIDPSITMNEGFYRPLKVNFPHGSLVNPRYPAAANLRLAGGQAIIDAINEALEPAYPELTTGAPSTVHTVTAHGKVPGSDERMWSMLDVSMGPGGARAGIDADDGLPFLMHGNSGYERNTEGYEISYPVIYRRVELVPDSGGPGKWRGSCGIVREIEFLTDVQLTTRATDRCRKPPRGAPARKPGLGGSWILNQDQPDEQELPYKKTNHPARAGDVLTCTVSGGGGYGNPFERDPELVARDVRMGRVSIARAAADYGVVIDPKTGEVDAAGTARLRK
jgi:N-methylhydantoinase B